MTLIKMTGFKSLKEIKDFIEINNIADRYCLFGATEKIGHYLRVDYEELIKNKKRSVDG